MLSTSSERPLNEPVTCKESLSRLKSISNALGSGRKKKKVCMHGEIYIHTYIWHTVSKATELPTRSTQAALVQGTQQHFHGEHNWWLLDSKMPGS